MKILKWLLSWFGGPAAPAPDLVVKVQAETVKLCGFLPAAQTVGAIVGAMTGQSAAVTTALGVATTICKAVSSAKAQMPAYALAGDISVSLPVVNINGTEIVISGEFVKDGR